MKQVRTSLVEAGPESAREVLQHACTPEMLATGAAANVALCETQAGTIEEAAGHLDAAEQHYRRALPIWHQLGAAHIPYYATTLMDLGSLYRAQRRMDQAEEMLTRAFTLASQGGDAVNRDRLRAVTASRLGSFYSESDAPERGRPLLNAAIDMLRTSMPPKPAELAYACNALGMLDLREGFYKISEPNLREAVSVAERSLGDAHPDTAYYESNLALALYLEGEYDRAEVLLNRARYIAEMRLPAGHIRLGAILAVVTAVETAQGKFSRAETDGKRALSILAQWREPGSLDVAVLQVTLATLYLRQRKITEAAKILPEAVALERQMAGDSRLPDRRVLADGIRRLAELRALQRKWDEAQSSYAEAIQIYESTLGPGHPGIVPVRLEYADVLKHSGVSRR